MVLDRMRTVAPLAVMALISLLAACESEENSENRSVLNTQFGATEWVAIEPVQCMGNPWEMDWLMEHDGDYDSYPRDPRSPGLEPGEVEIIKDYYLRQGVTVSDTATAQRYEVVCLACSCPQGHTMFLRVRAEDVQTMIGFGYRVQSPPGDD